MRVAYNENSILRMPGELRSCSASRERPKDRRQPIEIQQLNRSNHLGQAMISPRRRNQVLEWYETRDPRGESIWGV